MRRYIFFLLALAIHDSVHGRCFHPNGTETTDQAKRRCSNDPTSPIYNICCALNRSVPFGGELVGYNFTADACLLNGICQNEITNEENPSGKTTYWREECTKSDWQQGNCPSYCLDDLGAGNVEMTPCDGKPTSDTWCCGDTTDCCGKVGEIKVAATVGVTATSSSSSSSSPSPSSTSSTATFTPTGDVSFPLPTPSPSSEPSKSSKMSGGAIAGAAIGATAALIVVFGAGYLIARRRKQQKTPHPYGNTADIDRYNIGHQYQGSYAPPVGQESTKYNQDLAQPQELDSEIPARELPVAR